MAYTVYNNDGSVLVSIPSGEVDDLTTSLTLIGKNVNNYGEIINNNFAKLLTSFANTFDKPPSNPQVGQLFYDRTQNKLKVFDGTSFKPQLQPFVDGSAPTGTITEGDLWFDTVNKQLKIYNNGWNTVGPQVAFSEGRHGITPASSSSYVLRNTIGQPQNVGVAYSRSNPYLLFVESQFQTDVPTSTLYLNTTTSKIVHSGTVVLNTLTVVKDLRVTGEIFVKDVTLTPYRGFTAAYNSGWLGAFTSTYTATNNFVRLELLPALFSTASTITNLLSEVKVALTSGTFTSTEIRHFRLEERISGLRVWEAYEVYDTTGTLYFPWFGSTFTNVVRTL